MKGTNSTEVKAMVIEDNDGISRCGACCCMLLADDNGDMPDICPACGATLDYSDYGSYYDI